MKVKCVSNDIGVLFKNTSSGELTVGKIYYAMLGGVNGNQFLVFNDKNEWDQYQPELFVPAGE